MFRHLDAENIQQYCCSWIWQAQMSSEYISKLSNDKLVRLLRESFMSDTSERPLLDEVLTKYSNEFEGMLPPRIRINLCCSEVVAERIFKGDLVVMDNDGNKL